LALERWRWMPNEFPQPPIIVNVPEFRLQGFDDKYQPAFTSKIVVGQAAEHRTPLFENRIRYLVFRPYWDVPPSITQAELLPELRKNRNYLGKHEYEIVGKHGQIIGPEGLNDDVLKQLGAGHLRIRQKPGNKNALGLVKFVLPNRDDVYLHSTPMQSLFAKPRRDLSHGCIRVERAADLANWLLREKRGWNSERIKKAMNGDDTLTVHLDKPVPVLIVYGTANVAENGEVHFFDDIYGYDAELNRILAKGYPYPK